LIHKTPKSNIKNSIVRNNRRSFSTTKDHPKLNPASAAFNDSFNVLKSMLKDVDSSNLIDLCKTQYKIETDFFSNLNSQIGDGKQSRHSNKYFFLALE
jgi:hypothetical protein